MSRVLTCGFEVGPAANINTLMAEDVGINLDLQNAATVTYDTATVRSGATSLKLSCGNNQGYQFSFRWTGTITFIYYVRMCVFYSTAMPTTSAWPCSLSDGTTGCEVMVSAAGALTLANASNDATIVSGGTVTTGQWYVLEFAYIPGGGTLPGGTTNQNGQLKVNGVSKGFGTVETTTSALRATLSHNAGGSQTTVANFDDWAINDNQGSVNNSWCGETGKIVLLKPTSDAATTGFTEGAGGTGSLFDAVNNLPPVGVVLASATNTSQIKSANNNATDNYQANLAAYTTAVASGGGGLASDDRVDVVQAVCNHAHSSTTSTTDGVQSISNPSGSEATDASGTTAGATFPTGWRTMKSGVIDRPTVTLASGPVVQFRRGAAADNAMADFIGLYVEYTPGAGGGGDHQMTLTAVSEADAENTPVLLQASAIGAGQIEYHYSGSGTSANPELSLGGAIAGTVPSATNNVWKDVTDAERQSGKDYYSCIFVKNTHPMALWRNVTAWIDDTEDQGTTSLGLDPGVVGGTAVTVANVNTAPTGVTFASPTTKAAGTVIGDIPAGSYKAFWEKRSFPAGGTAMASDAISVRVEGESTV